MTISRTITDDRIVLHIDGKIDTNTSKELETALVQAIEGTSSVVLDFEKVIYISSAGLRTLLLGEKKSKKLGATMVICNICENVFDVFEMTGFSEILAIQ